MPKNVKNVHVFEAKKRGAKAPLLFN